MREVRSKGDSKHLVNDCLRNEAIAKFSMIKLPINNTQWDTECLDGPLLWLVVLVKFHIWKVYANQVYGDGNQSPTWFLSALKEWLDLGFSTGPSMFIRNENRRRQIGSWAKSLNLHKFL